MPKEKDILWWYNANGLVGGEIPPRKSCPWVEECQCHTNRCPGVIRSYEEDGLIITPSKPVLYPHPFSCALARLYSLMSEKDPALKH